MNIPQTNNISMQNKKKEHRYYVYIGTNHPRHTVLYTGVTSGLMRRDGQHKDKVFKNSFSAKYNINRIVYYEVYGDIGMAITREKQIKRLVRRKKIKLIESTNPEWEDLIEEMWK